MGIQGLQAAAEGVAPGHEAHADRLILQFCLEGFTVYPTGTFVEHTAQ